MIATPGQLFSDTIRILIGWMAVDLIRWLWDHGAEDARPRRTDYDRRCEWCSGVRIVTRASMPPPDELPEGWVGTEGGKMAWCSLRCWVEHWRADPRIEAPPVASAAGAWGPDDWPEVDSD